jgi:hypothetical protein
LVLAINDERKRKADSGSGRRAALSFPARVVDLKFATSFAASPEANFKSENHTRNVSLLVSSIRS